AAFSLIPGETTHGNPGNIPVYKGRRWLTNDPDMRPGPAHFHTLQCTDCRTWSRKHALSISLSGSPRSRVCFLRSPFAAIVQEDEPVPPDRERRRQGDGQDACGPQTA